MIRDAQPEDAGKIARIYNHYIEDTIITFEEEPVDEAIICGRIEKIRKKSYPFIVYEENGEVLGYAYSDTWRERPAYNITLETSIYVDHNYLGKGIGNILYAGLIEKSKTIGIHSLIGVISLPNDPSRSLHRKFHFDLIGCFKESGIKFGKLIDVEFWQLKLNDR
jgi:phosphinothricin acetyltransferase